MNAENAPSRRGDTSADDVIELRPLAGEVSGRPDGLWPRMSPSPPEGSTSPVPGRPLHRCPTCDYILTGLTARRCPECGQAFTLADARRKAFEKSLGAEALFASDQFDRIKLYVGAASIAVGTLLPVVFATGSGPPAGIGLAREHWGFFALPPLLALAVFYRVAGGVPWSRAILAIGVVALVLGVLLSLC